MITLERARVILQCYGSQPSVWPEHEREDMLGILQNNNELKALQHQASLIDNFAGLYELSNPGSLMDRQQEWQCAENILACLPEQMAGNQTPPLSPRFELFFQQLMQRFERLSPNIVMTGVVLMVIGFSIGVNVNNYRQDALLSLQESIAFYVDDGGAERSAELDETVEMIAFIEPQVIELYEE